MPETYFKAVRPDGTDFHTGRIDYFAEGEITHPAPSAKGTKDAAGYLSVAIVATDCTGFSWPARLLEVEAVGPVWAPHSDLPNKRAVKALRVVRELDAHLLLGPQGQEIAALVERAKTLTYEDGRQLAAAWGAACDAAWGAAWGAACDAAWGAAWGAARGAARGAAWDAARGAALDAARALIIRDLIGTAGYTQEHYDIFTGPWRRIIGRLHPDDVDLRAEVTK